MLTARLGLSALILAAVVCVPLGIPAQFPTPGERLIRQKVKNEVKKAENQALEGTAVGELDDALSNSSDDTTSSKRSDEETTRREPAKSIIRAIETTSPASSEDPSKWKF